jgi:hypothetical protein
MNIVATATEQTSDASENAEFVFNKYGNSMAGHNTVL